MRSARPHVLMPAWWFGWSMVAACILSLRTDWLAARMIAVGEAVRKWWAGQ